MKKDLSIVIYDGECNLCDSSVNFILKHEKEKELFFTHLKASTGQKIKAEFNLADDFDGVLLFEKGRLYIKSEAALRISLYLKKPYSFFAYFFWVPLFIRDGIYNFIAKKRYAWFGKDDCLIPDISIRKRFIE
jgi:predicted DCC family thiol-disulfide oxidoreductase YuxK